MVTDIEIARAATPRNIAEIAARRGAFTLDDVAQAFVTKMRSRAPYLFDGTEDVVGVEEQERLWVEGKARENA